MEFLTHEQAEAYGKFAEEPTRPERERFFLLDDIDRDLIALRRTGRHQLGFALQMCTVRCVGLFLEDPLAVPWPVIEHLAAHAEGRWRCSTRRWADCAFTRWCLPGVSVLPRRVSGARMVAEKRLHATVAKAARRADAELPEDLVATLKTPEGKWYPELERLRRARPRRRRLRRSPEVPDPRFVLVPALREKREVPVPADRAPAGRGSGDPRSPWSPAPRTGATRADRVRQDVAPCRSPIRAAQDVGRRRRWQPWRGPDWPSDPPWKWTMPLPQRG